MVYSEAGSVPVTVTVGSPAGPGALLEQEAVTFTGVISISTALSIHRHGERETKGERTASRAETAWLCM